MDKYQGYKDFVTNYEVDEKNNEIVIQYADKTSSTVVNSDHNISVMERRLYEQHQEAMEKVIPRWKSQMHTCGYAILNFMGFIGAELAIDKPKSAAYCVACTVFFGCIWMKNHRQVSRIKLTDYCVKNADSIQLVKTNPNVSLKLSKNGSQAFEMDQGFSLNHAHLYTNRDLKTLKKVKKQEPLQESSNE